MKKFLLILCICLLLAGCSQSNSSKKVTVHSIPNVQHDEIATIIESGNYIIVDVRTKEEYDESHVKGAINIPYDQIDENINLDKTKTIMVYCKSGVRSNKAFNTLTSLGYNAYDMGAFSNLELEKE